MVSSKGGTGKTTSSVFLACALHRQGADVLQSGGVTPVRDEPVTAPRPSSAARPTRITVDLAADLHSFLRAYAQARDIAAADVIRELIPKVRADANLSSRVTAELERRREALAEAMRAARE